MKLFYALASPFVRKCLVAAHELGLRDRIELVSAVPSPVNRDANVVAHNPLGKIPTLITADGVTLYDSRVICEFLDDLGGRRLLPAAGPRRWSVLVDQSLADGIMDAAVLGRYETFARPEALRWDAWLTGQFAKVDSSLNEFERRAAALGDRIDVGTIALGAALGYLDFRYASLAWRDRHPLLAQWFETFAARDSMKATNPFTA